MSPRPDRPVPPPFERVVDAHGDAVLRFCTARAGPALAEDCFQATMLAALRAYDDLRDPDAVRGWLFTIAARTAADLHRDGARRPAPREDAGADVATTDPEPTDDALWRAVAALPAKQREAVALRFVADLPYREVGRAAGTSEEAARRNVHEGLRSLRARTRPHGSPTGAVPRT